MHKASFFRKFWGGAVSMPIKRLFIVYLFWIKFCLSVRLRDCSLVHSLSLICYLVKMETRQLADSWDDETFVGDSWPLIHQLPSPFKSLSPAISTIFVIMSNKRKLEVLDSKAIKAKLICQDCHRSPRPDVQLYICLDCQIYKCGTCHELGK